jgi:hypothetical protein
MRVLLYSGAHFHPFDTIPSPTSTAFTDYVMTLPIREQDLLILEKPLTTPLNQPLLQKDASLLAVRDGGAFNPYGSFGWVLGTDQGVLWECKGIA